MSIIKIFVYVYKAKLRHPLTHLPQVDLYHKSLDWSISGCENDFSTKSFQMKHETIILPHYRVVGR